MPGLATYCGSKALVSTFSEALSFEVRDKIDVTTWELGPASTNLFEKEKEKPPGCFTLSAKRSV